MAQSNTDKEASAAMTQSMNTDKEAAMVSAPSRSDGFTQFTAEEGIGPEQLVTGVSETMETMETIGLKLDPFGNTESSDDSPAFEGKYSLPIC